MEGIKYSPHPTPEDWKKAEDNLSNKQKLASDLRQMEIRPSQEQLNQIFYGRHISNEESDGDTSLNTETSQASKVEEAIEISKKNVLVFKEMIDSGYLDNLKESDFTISSTTNRKFKFEGSEHFNTSVNLHYKNEDLQFSFEDGSDVSRAVSIFIPGNFDEKIEDSMRKESIILMVGEIKKDIHNYINEWEEFNRKKDDLLRKQTENDISSTPSLEEMKEVELNKRRIIESCKEIMDSGYLDSLKFEDFSIFWYGTHEFEGREHANFYITFEYKGEEYEFNLKLGSEGSRLLSKHLPENFDRTNLSSEDETVLNEEMLSLLKKESKKYIISYIESADDYITAQ